LHDSELQEIASRLDTICGWLSHLEKRVQAAEEALAARLNDRMLESEARLASWVEWLERNREMTVHGELREFLQRLDSELDRWDRMSGRLLDASAEPR
jgi:hypothetical protein